MKANIMESNIMDASIIESVIRQTPDFLPVTPSEAEALTGSPVPDFALITGDAYVDHPSFGAAVIGKLLWAAGYSVGVIPQPDYKNAAGFRAFGKPRLGFLVTGGCVDSMVNNYTVSLSKRSADEYSEGGTFGKRPDRAASVYCRKLRDIYGKGVPIILGGIEASLRRLTHYDYWSDSFRKPILLDSGADICVYGMGERAVLEIAALLAADVPAEQIRHVYGTAVKALSVEKPDWDGGALRLPNSFDIGKDRKLYASAFKTQYANSIYGAGKTVYELYNDNGRKTIIAQNPPAKPLDQNELDAVYGLNFARASHPMYKKPVPSIAEVQFSVTANRGCFGGCSFCALTYHQGKAVTGRSAGSVVSEIETISKLKGFKGYIHDLGGPTANFHAAACDKLKPCGGNNCMTCPNLNTDQSGYTRLLAAAASVQGVKKVFVRSGVRYDYAIMEKGGGFLRALCENHISGQLKVAPEHVSPNVLALMNKPKKSVYEKFVARYNKINAEIGKEQYLVPYFMSSHPGSGLNEAVELAEYMRDNHINPKQVQDFYPTPGTASTCMYASGVNPFDGKPVYVCRDRREKAMQRALLQYKLPRNRALVREALIKAGRKDLIGYGGRCFVKPER